MCPSRPTTPLVDLPCDRWLPLREALEDGVSSLHVAIEAAAVRDAQRRIDGTALQALARGTEVLEKTIWVLNRLRATGSFPEERELRRTLGHSITSVHKDLIRQAESLTVAVHNRYDVAFLSSDVCLQAILELAETFALQGRYRHLTALLTGTDETAMYLAWNVRIEPFFFNEPHAPKFDERDPKTWVHLRRRQVAVLQRLLRSLARQGIDAQKALNVVRIAHGRTLDKLAGLDEQSLEMPAALPNGCACSDMDLRRVAIYVPVEDDTT